MTFISYRQPLLGVFFFVFITQSEIRVLGPAYTADKITVVKY